MAKRLDPNSEKVSSHKSRSPRIEARARQKDAAHGQNDRVDWVAVQLRELYGEVTREPVPESLLELLRKLEEADHNG